MRCIMTLTTEELNDIWTDITNNDDKSSDIIISKINALIKNNPDDCATAIDSGGRTLLFMAATIGNDDLVQQLIDKGADVNKEVTYTRLSDVMAGVSIGTLMCSMLCFLASSIMIVASYIMNLGAISTNTSLITLTPLPGVAAVALLLHGLFFLTTKFLSRNDYLRSFYNSSPLSQAVNHGHDDTVEFLLRNGADVRPILYDASKVVREYKAYMRYANEYFKEKNIGANDLDMSAAEINIAKYELGKDLLKKHKEQLKKRKKPLRKRKEERREQCKKSIKEREKQRAEAISRIKMLGQRPLVKIIGSNENDKTITVSPLLLMRDNVRAKSVRAKSALKQ